ncbi:long-chain acyl-CoA synthetase [Geoalkalibacter ferrihydriticus]|uniref:Long-chain acyl-CoA synthetase n=1 Tax=Geoalkalibacter ferrihydriticus TaxID=392333 RepID=A0A1G9IKH5_9BACT|nr:long-chain fatty acid--CoA ligase [Geoalkalibacter ferrihydriticus]SDL25596.1 long-chain acyl-CoA synthetase [Geoalkalibacter ferrihydriticus]
MNDTIVRMVLSNAEKWSQQPALMHKEQGTYRNITWQQLGEEIHRFGRALLALGTTPGARVAIIGPNSPRWAFVDLGSMACGAATVPVYHTEGQDAIVHILADSGSRTVFVHSARIGAELLHRRHELPELKQLVFLAPELSHPGILSLEEFLSGGDKIPPRQLESTLAAGKPRDLATLVYTSGTTGAPKGVMLSHANILSNIQDVASLFPIGPSDICLSFLPLSHVFERVDGYYFMLYRGVTIAYAESIEAVPVNLAEIHPTIMISVPRLYEKMFARIMERVLSGPWLRKQIFFGALKAGRSGAALRLAGKEPGAPLALLLKLADRAVFSKLRDHLGGQLRFFVSGGAPLSVDIAEFFLAAGIDIYEGYGLTESAGGITVNTPDARRLGTVGRPFASIEVRIAEDGEILLRGPVIFQGYWQRPEDTSAAFDDGWFKTGDNGEFDADGFLRIVDRKKDIIITASGENIAPQNIENHLKTDKFIANAMIYGDRKPYLTALLVPNLDNLEKFAREQKLDFLDHCDLVNHPQVLSLVRSRVDRLQKDMASFQRIKRFTLLAQDFSKEEITPTMKLKRQVVTDHYADILEGMYAAKDHGVHDSGFCQVENT